MPHADREATAIGVARTGADGNPLILLKGHEPRIAAEATTGHGTVEGRFVRQSTPVELTGTTL